MKYKLNQVYNEDCVAAMKTMPDNYFDLAIVDPEFGIGIGSSPRLVTDKGLEAKEWDDKPIDMDYFDQLFRVSKNHIVWGGNYYPLPATKHCIIWDKKQPEKLSFGMFDYAWTSYVGANKIFRQSVQQEKDKIHPTQKPVKLYRWLLDNYAKPDMKILDTHLGSASSILAMLDFGCDWMGFETDKKYYDNAVRRINNHIIQPKADFNQTGKTYSQLKIY